MYYFDNPEKTPFNLVMGVTLDQREYFRDYRLTQKGKLLWDQIYMLHWYVIRLQRIYNFLLFHAVILPLLDVYGLYFTHLYHFWD